MQSKVGEQKKSRGTGDNLEEWITNAIYGSIDIKIFLTALMIVP